MSGWIANCGLLTCWKKKNTMTRNVRRRLLPRTRSHHGALCTCSCKLSLMAWISASQFPLWASSFGLKRRRDATASSSRSLDKSQRGEFGMKNVNAMMTGHNISSDSHYGETGLLTSWKDELNACDRLPSYACRASRKCFVHTSS